MKGPDDSLISALNDELLTATKEPAPTEKETKRNSKEELIKRIVSVAEDNQITVEVSNTKMRRMNKSQLGKLLAGTIEKAQQSQMAAQVGVAKNASERVIALGALRMLHNLAANATEKGLNTILPKYGYEVDGFTKSLDNPPVKEAVDACLEEIARESDVLQYIESPYARLGLAWGGALITSLKTKAKVNRFYATNVGSAKTCEKNPVQPRPDRRSAAGEKLRSV